MKTPARMLAESLYEDYKEAKSRERSIFLREWEEAIQENRRLDAMPKDILEEIEGWNTKTDQEYLAYLKKEKPEFNKLYLKHFNNPLYRGINLMVITDINNEMETVDARLYQYQASSRGIRYRLAGNTATPGQTRN